MNLRECLKISENWGEKTSVIFSIFALHGKLGIREVREKYAEIYGKGIPNTTARTYIEVLCVSSFIKQVERNEYGKIFYDVNKELDDDFIELMKNDI